MYRLELLQPRMEPNETLPQFGSAGNLLRHLPTPGAQEHEIVSAGTSMLGESVDLRRGGFRRTHQIRTRSSGLRSQRCPRDSEWCIMVPYGQHENQAALDCAVN